MDIFEEIDDTVDYFQNLFLETSQLHIPHKTVTIRPKDKPWFTNTVRRAFRKRDRAHTRWKKNPTNQNYNTYHTLRHEANQAKSIAKTEHFTKLSQKLVDPSTSSKQYWNITKQLYGNKVHAGIPPLKKNGVVYTSSEDKCNIFNKTFTEKAKLPETKPNLPPLQFKTDQRLDSIETTEEEVQKILKSLDISKSNGPDGISNRLLKQTAAAIAKPLSIIFNLSLSSSKFPTDWKKANVSPIYKKNDRQNDSNYRPISLLSCIGKVLERIVFIRLYEFCMRHNLLTWRNSGYKHKDSTINQLIYISHHIYDALTKGLDVCFVSLDASSAFDRVWHDGLLFKLKSLGVSGSLLAWFKDYLSRRMQRVVIGGSSSEWIYIKAGVPQGSILGPLLFLIYIEDIIDNINSEILLFADDTCLLKTLTHPLESIACINDDLETLRQWSTNWLVNFNPTKTKYMVLSKKLTPPVYNDLFIGTTKLEKVGIHKQLGITFNNSMTWEHHITDICKRAGSRIDLIRRLPASITPLTKLHIYTTFVRPLLEYGNVLFDNCTGEMQELLENTQRQAALAITRAYQHTSHNNLLQELGLITLQERRTIAKLTLFYKIKSNLTPDYLKTLIPNEVGQDQPYQLRNARAIKIPKCTKNYFLKSYIPSTIKMWNDLPLNIRLLDDLDTFKNELARLKDASEQRPYSPYLSSSGNGNIYLSRIRMGLSGLNSHRKKYHFIDHNLCPYCHSTNENEIHFILLCANHAAPRGDMIVQLRLLLPQHATLLANFNTKAKQKDLCKLLINGTGSAIVDTQIFKVVSEFIIKTKRFDLTR